MRLKAVAGRLHRWSLVLPMRVKLCRTSTVYFAAQRRMQAACNGRRGHFNKGKFMYV
jgi:hypothetical protein